jgi:biopolymer transport protein ExbB/TolQ
MTPITLSIAVLYGMLLISLALGLFALLRANVLARAARIAAEARDEGLQAGLDDLVRRLDELTSQIREIQEQPTAPAHLPRAGFNLTKRSQALRMHRRGEDPERIAAALESPVQEIELLLKVHRIVIGQL